VQKNAVGMLLKFLLQINAIHIDLRQRIRMIHVFTINGQLILDWQITALMAPLLNTNSKQKDIIKLN
jgi:hypothetical protein